MENKVTLINAHLSHEATRINIMIRAAMPTTNAAARRENAGRALTRERRLSFPFLKRPSLWHWTVKW